MSDRRHKELGGNTGSAGEGTEPARLAPIDGFWERQNAALGRARKRQEEWIRSRRRCEPDGSVAWKRETMTLPRNEARQRAREFLRKYPKAAYWSEVESWRELPGDLIEFTMRRLPSAD